MIFKSSNHPFHSKTRFQHESFKRKKLSISFKFSFNFNFIVSLFYIVLFSQNVFLVRIIVCSRKPENVFLVMLRKKVLAYFRILEMEKGGGGGGGGHNFWVISAFAFVLFHFFFRLLFLGRTLEKHCCYYKSEYKVVTCRSSQKYNFKNFLKNIKENIFAVKTFIFAIFGYS